MSNLFLFFLNDEKNVLLKITTLSAEIQTKRVGTPTCSSRPLQPKVTQSLKSFNSNFCRREGGKKGGVDRLWLFSQQPPTVINPPPTLLKSERSQRRGGGELHSRCQGDQTESEMSFEAVRGTRLP